MNNLKIHIESTIKAHGKYMNGADGWLIGESEFKPLIKEVIRLFQTNIVPLPKGTTCKCGRTADGTLYDEPVCEGCMYQKIK